jgi:eukaryotic-like serine/threonine-protein kinase
LKPERWTQVREILDEAIALPPDQRAAYLDRVCSHDAELRMEVESLLQSHERAGSIFLKNPAVDLKSAVSDMGGKPDRIGRRIGVYQIVEQIGHGGMGEVYRAVRADGQYDKQVAIKLVRTGFDSSHILERFRQERQILASLDHPNIARLHDGGTTEEGIPYLVMELIEGTPIDQYCDQQQLGVPERLLLFVQVCSAVQYAHQRLVIHRDIKPSNILVTGDGVPKLLDFGIAKILDPAAGAETTLVRPMTPEYASPEQIRGEPITTATDVYSQGVVLYRLLTGRSPYPENVRTPLEYARIICEVEAARPSTAIAPRMNTAELKKPGPAAMRPGHEGVYEKLGRRLRGDLDNIVLKALRKEPGRRYASVEQFAEDIRRHLQGLPVTATPDSFSYRVGKFIQRHRVGVAATAVILVLIAGGVITTVREARIAEANRHRAEARFNDVRKLANSLIFEVHDSIADLPGASAARKLILQRALQYLDSLSKEAGNEPDLLRELATAYERIGALQGDPLDPNLGDMKGAAISLQKSVELRESLARLNPKNSQDQVQLAVAYLDLSDFQAGVVGNIASGFDYCKKAQAILDREAAADPNNFHIIAQDTRAYTSLGFLQVGNGAVGTVGTVAQGVADLQKALLLDQRAIRISPSMVNVRGQEAVITLELGDAMLKLGDRSRAVDYYHRSVDIMSSLNTKGDNIRIAGNQVVATGKMGDALLIEGRIAEAVSWYAKNEQGAAQLAAKDPSNEPMQRLVITSSAQLGHALIEDGQIDKGLKYLHTALAKAQAQSSQTPLIRIFQGIINMWFGEASERKGKIAEAVQNYQKSQEILGAVRAAGANDLRTQVYYCSSTDRLGAAWLKFRKPANAEKEYEKSLALLEPLTKASPDNAEALYALAETYTGEGNVSAQLARETRKPNDQAADWNAARAWYQKSLNIWSRVINPSRISTSTMEVTVPGEVSRRLAECQAQQSANERLSLAR